MEHAPPSRTTHRPEAVEPSNNNNNNDDETSSLGPIVHPPHSPRDTAVSMVVDKRLQSPWGRRRPPDIHDESSSSVPSSVMHDYIACIRPQQLSSSLLSSGNTNDTSWRMIEERCLSHPHEASHLDRRGRTCLHAACAKKPPHNTVVAILEAHKGRYLEPLVQRDKHGRTPLTIAVSSNADVRVIETLLTQCPHAAAMNDHLGHLPLHLACAGYDGGGSGGRAKVVGLLLRAFPEAASRETFNGRTPLHSAMEGRASAQVVQQLVEACPEAVVNDSCGLNPLFVAIRYNSSVDVVRSMVKAYPEATLTRDRGHGLPLRRAIENQSPVEIQACLCTSPDVVLDADSYVHNTALHEALECGTAKESMVELLVRTAPVIALTPSKSGQTPLNLACQRFLRLSAQGRRDEMPLKQLWRIVVHLMRAAHYGDFYVATRTPILHAAVALPVPPEIWHHALKVYERDFLVVDCRGRYPLHAAIESCPPQGRMLNIRTYETYLQHKEQVVFELLRLRPSSIHETTLTGRTPLSLASGAHSISCELLAKLWNLCASVLRTRDTELGLYPFQIAALPRETLARVDWQSREDENRLTMIYVLMRQAPDLVLRHGRIETN